RGTRCRKCGARDRDGWSHPIVCLLPVRHDDVERVGGAALKETDERLAPGIAQRPSAIREALSERGASQERGIQSHRHQCQRAVFHEYASLHISSTAAVVPAASSSLLKLGRG